MRTNGPFADAASTSGTHIRESSANSLITLESTNGPSCRQTSRLCRQRRQNAKTFRGDVSEKFRCIAPPHDSMLSLGNRARCIRSPLEISHCALIHCDVSSWRKLLRRDLKLDFQQT